MLPGEFFLPFYSDMINFKIAHNILNPCIADVHLCAVINFE